jgi:hypothetical protein
MQSIRKRRARALSLVLFSPTCVWTFVLLLQFSKTNTCAIPLPESDADEVAIVSPTGGLTPFKNPRHHPVDANGVPMQKAIPPLMDPIPYVTLLSRRQLLLIIVCQSLYIFFPIHRLLLFQTYGLALIFCF